MNGLGMPEGVGYFGKLPDRADFITGQCPSGFLRLWEPFLMAGLAQSRDDLGTSWDEAYLTMPVWRFALWPVCGNAPVSKPVAGAFMPSVDRVGRLFPLTLAGSMSGPTAGGPVGSVPEEDWYEGVEAVLLGTLEDDSTLEGFQKAVTELKGADQGFHAHPGVAAKTLLGAGDRTRHVVKSRFWCRAGASGFDFSCSGLPAAVSFRWLILPETFQEQDTGEDRAGQDHGRYQREDDRT